MNHIWVKSVVTSVSHTVFWHTANGNLNSPWTPARPSAAPLLHCLPDELWCECVRFRLHRHAWLSVPHVPFHACLDSKHLTYHECLHLQPGWIQLGRSRFYGVVAAASIFKFPLHLNVTCLSSLLWICRCVCAF